MNDDQATFFRNSNVGAVLPSTGKRGVPDRKNKTTFLKSLVPTIPAWELKGVSLTLQKGSGERV